MTTQSDIEQLIDNVICTLRPMIESPDAHPFPNGSCVGVSAFLVPFVRLLMQTHACRVVLGRFDGKVHAWIECITYGHEVWYIDPTVHQFDKNAPRAMTPPSKRYKPIHWLSREQEEALRDHSEPAFSALSTRDGKALLHALPQ